MLTIEVSVQADLDPVASHVLDEESLAAAPSHPSLRVTSLAGSVLSLGRYHLAPAGDPAGQVCLHRRLGGGRVMPLGPGFASLLLALPHRSALVADDEFALRPEQTLNRCVRGLLGGLRALGVDAFYPGRDRITIDRHTVGLVSLECDARGATVFEAALAIDGDWLALTDRVAAVDRDGVLAVEVPAADQFTSLAEHGARPSLAELARYVGESYAGQFGISLAAGPASIVPAGASAHAAPWLASRRQRAELDRHVAEWGQVGVFEVYLRTAAGRIEDVLMAGDFIADSPSIARLEQRLRGCALSTTAVGSVIEGVYADARSFLLGVGMRQTLVDTIVSAA